MPRLRSAFFLGAGIDRTDSEFESGMHASDSVGGGGQEQFARKCELHALEPTRLLGDGVDRLTLSYRRQQK